MHARASQTPSCAEQSPIHLTGDEELEVLDISESPDLPGADTNHANAAAPNPLEARLLDDGRCLVKILRPDGRTDFYCLYEDAVDNPYAEQYA